MIKAIVPVKLNSKRLPLKNIKKINGKPLIEWTVETLNKVEEISEIIVYCSDEDIENYITSEHTFIKRNPMLDRDDMNIHNILNTLIIEDDIHSDFWILQHCTSPFIKSDTISDMINKVVSGEYHYDSAFSVNKYQKYGWYMGKPLNFNTHNIGFTQTTEPIYIETSGPYIFTEEQYTRTGNRIGSRPYMKVIHFIEGIDIDTKEDFELAKLIGENYDSGNTSKV